MLTLTPKKIVLLAVLIIALPSLLVANQLKENEQRNTYYDLAYASISQKQKLDLYLPDNSTDLHPLIIWIHGGAFLMGDKAAFTEINMINKLIARGFAVASINYRFSSEAIYPAQIFDCKAAVRFLRANAQQYNLDSERFISWGGSAGGCLSSLLGTTGGIEELEGSELGNAEYSSRVKVSVDWFGPIEFLTMDEQAQEQGFTINTNSATSPESRLIGAAIQTVPLLTNKANAKQYVSSDDAAMVCQHGTADTNIPILQSYNLYQTILDTLGQDKALYTLIQNAGHGGSLFETDSNIDMIIDFINNQFTTTDIEDSEIHPQSLNNIRIYPNPFNPSTRISFENNADSSVNINIYNIKGQIVKNLFDKNLPKGTHSVEWNGLDNNNNVLPSGTYLCKITNKSYSLINKMILLK